MANDKKKMVEAITAQEVDFAQWYTDICTKAELVEYSSVKGFVVLRPYGYAIWENIQRIMDGMFKNCVVAPAEVKAKGMEYFDDNEDLKTAEKLIAAIEQFLRS